MAQNPSSEDRFGFDFQEKTEHTGEISSKPYEATSGFALNELIGGSYRVLEFIGEGGMGLVYKVEHIHMNKILALKVLKTQHLSENVWKRFRLEAQAISRLDHANIIKIYDMNQTPDGRPFYTMELLAGESLADYLQEQRQLPLKHALPIFRQVCSALAYAHERGIIHRDIKPGNIMLLEPAGSGLGCLVKIVDFGIVKVLGSEEQIGQGLTRPGEVFGSPLYMSPEQCAGSKLDARADMYSVGVTLFQALAGKPPLVGRTAAETVIMHYSAIPPAMSELAGIDFPHELEDVVAKMLAKAPEDRYSSLAEVARILLALEGKYSGSLREAIKTLPSQNQIQSLPDHSVIDEKNEDDQFASTRETNGFKSLLALAALFTVVAVGIIMLLDARLLTGKPKPKAPRPLASSIKTSASSEEEKKLHAAETDQIEVSVTADKQEKLELFLRERKEPYFVTGEDGITKFSFPAQFPIGTLKYLASGGIQEQEAQGHFEAFNCRKISFEANPLTVAQPDLLKFFPANRLNVLMFLNGKPRAPKLVDYIMKQQSLETLVLEGTAINETDLKRIASLKKLVFLTFDTDGISNKVLLDSGLLSRLEGVGLLDLRDCRPVLQALVSSPMLESLTLSGSALSKSDFAIIGRMTRLKHLGLRGTALDDDDLLLLTKLQNLESLNLYGTAVTKASIATLKKFPRLKDFDLPAKVKSAYYKLEED
jgi:serine/threonine protein kinase